MLSLAIIIPNFNGLQHLQRCLPSVCRHAPPGTHILVVDDASHDGSVAWIRQHAPLVEVLELATNHGFASAVNHGLQRTQADIVELLNNDTEVCAGWAEASLAHFGDPTVGSVAPLVLQMDAPDTIDSAGQEYDICGWAYNRGYGCRLEASYAASCEVFGPSGSSGFYRRSALTETGFLLPEYDAYFEDTDLAFRLRWAGYRCIYEPAARVLHKGSASYRQLSELVEQLLARNEELAYWSNLSGLDLLLSSLPHLGFLVVRTLRHVCTGRLWPFLRGKGQALASWRFILERRRRVRALAAKAPYKPSLGISRHLDVLQRGVTWLRYRRAA